MPFFPIKIRFEDSSTNWQTAIRTASQSLLDEDLITENYVDKMIQNVKDLGEYILLAPNIAMPHARPEDGSNGTAISFLKLKQAVPFDSGRLVSLFIVLATKNSEDHLELLAKVAQLIDSSEKIDQLIASKTPKDFLSLCQLFLQEEE